MAGEIPGSNTPAVLVNRFNVRSGPDHWRFVFFDAIEGFNGRERAHIVMTRTDVESLHEVLGNMLKAT